MKKQFLILLASLALTKAQGQILVLSPGSTVLHYLKGTGSSITIPVDLTLFFNGQDVRSDVPVRLITKSSNSALVADSLILVPDPAAIPAPEFSKARKEKKLRVNLTINGAANLLQPATVDLFLENSTAEDAHFRIEIDTIPLSPSPGNSIVISHIPRTDTLQLAPLVRNEAATEQRMMQLAYRVDGRLQRDSTVELELVTNKGSRLQPVLRTKTFTIRKEQTASGTYSGLVNVYFDINAVKDFGEDEFLALRMKNGNEQDFAVVTRSKLIHPNKAFWIEAGANFDLIDGIKANNLFAGIFLYKRDIRSFRLKRAKAGQKHLNLNLSILGGIYESKSLSNETNDNTTLEYIDNRSLSPDTANRYAVFRDTGSITNNSTISNIGLFFSPQVRLTEGSANSDGFHVFASAWFEIIWHHVSTTIDYSKTSGYKTTWVKQDSLVYFSRKVQKTEEDYRSQYIGLGLPMFLKDGDINLYCSPVIGLTNQGFGLKSTIAGNTDIKTSLLYKPERKWNPFFVFMFRLSEEKYGISFTGEVRGLIMADVKPVISIALSKKFDLSKLLEYR